MAYLTRPERCVYESQGMQSGLTGVVAVVTRPDGIVLGPYLMREFAHPLFKGLYYFDFLTSVTDPTGNYTFVMISQMEGLRIAYKAQFDLIPGELTTFINQPLPTDIVGEIEDLSEIAGSYEDYDQIMGTIFDLEELSGAVSDVEELAGSF